MELLDRYSNQTHVLDKLTKILNAPPRSERVERKPRQKQVHLNEANQQLLIESYSRLRSVYAVAHEFGVRRQTVAAILERHGVKRRYKIMSAKSIVRAKQLYESGKSLVDVGDELNVDSKTVRKALLEAGVTMRPVGTNQWSS